VEGEKYAKTKEAPAPKQEKAAPAKSKPLLRPDRHRAYEIYLERGFTPGDPMQDWLRAESELIAPPRNPAPNPK